MAPKKRKTAAEQEREESEDEAAAAKAAREKKWQAIKKRAGFCGLCCDILRDFAGQLNRPQTAPGGPTRPQEAAEVPQTTLFAWFEAGTSK